MAQGQLSVDAFGPDNKTVIDRGKLMVVDNQIDQATGTHQAEGGISQRRPATLAGAVRERAAAGRHAQAGRRGIDRGGAARAERTIRVRHQDDNTVAMRPVTITQQDEDQSVIATGLQSGERVVTTGFNQLADGTRRQRRPASAGSAPAGAPVQPARQEITSVAMTAPRNPASRRATRNAEPSGRGPARRHERAERFRALYPPPDRDIAARPGGAAGRDARLFAAVGVLAAARRFSDHSGLDAASGRQPGHDRGTRHRAARTPIRPDPIAGDDDVVRARSGSARSRCSSISTATSTAPRRTCRPRSMLRVRPCRRTCRIRRPIRRSIRPTRRSSRSR